MFHSGVSKSISNDEMFGSGVVTPQTNDEMFGSGVFTFDANADSCDIGVSYDREYRYQDRIYAKNNPHIVKNASIEVLYSFIRYQ